MCRNVRLTLLALALVLCALASVTAPASAKVDPFYFCGQNPPECFLNQDCNAYCQPCGYVGLCQFWSRDPTAPGFCSCH